MIEQQKEMGNEHIRQVALQMMTAARTAPKARGVDNLEIAAVTGEDIARLAERMEALVAAGEAPAFFRRDAGNILQAGAIVLIGTRNAILGLNCGWCGHPTCTDKTEKAPAAPCAFNMNDLGIAIGSAVSVASNCRVDSRVMYSVGVVAKQLHLLPDCHAILAIPISATAKSPFFDRG